MKVEILEELLIDVKVINKVFIRVGHSLEYINQEYYAIGNIYKAKQYSKPLLESPEGDGINQFVYKVYSKHPAHSYLFTKGDFDNYFIDIVQDRNNKLNILLNENI